MRRGPSWRTRWARRFARHIWSVRDRRSRHRNSNVDETLFGILRNATKDWNAAVMLDAGIILVRFVLFLFLGKLGKG